MSFKLTSKGSRQTLEKIIQQLEDRTGELCPALSLKKGSAKHWLLEIYFDEGLEKDSLNEQISPIFANQKYTLDTLPDIDWVAESQSALQPVLAGRYFVHGAHDRKRAPFCAHKILIEAGTAFGTGHHGTTKACLLALAHIDKKYHPRHILDLGCGSGILAIAAAITFHTSVLASDIDTESVAVSKRNIRQNKMGSFVRALKSTGFQHLQISNRGPFDLVLANILAAPLCAMAGDMKEHTMPGSRLILSGMLTGQGRRVEATYRAHGFYIEKRIILGEWLTLILFRK